MDLIKKASGKIPVTFFDDIRKNKLIFLLTL